MRGLFLTREEAEGQGNDHAWKPLPSSPPAPGWHHLSGGGCNLSRVFPSPGQRFAVWIIWVWLLYGAATLQVLLTARSGTGAIGEHKAAPPWDELQRGHPPSASCKEASQTQAMFRPLGRGKKFFFFQQTSAGSRRRTPAASQRRYLQGTQTQQASAASGLLPPPRWCSSSRAPRGVPAPCMKPLVEAHQRRHLAASPASPLENVLPTPALKLQSQRCAMNDSSVSR